MRLLDALWRLFRRPSAEPLTGLDAERTRLIVGLGNPGPEYADTRHNIGFRTVEEIARRFGAPWQDKTAGLDSLVALVRRDEPPNLVLAKPQTYMNRSGTAVRDLLEFLKLQPQQALVVYDDMDLPFGTLRLRERGSAGTHNGMRSVLSSLGTQDVARLRVGISQSGPGEATNHVLSDFTEDEQEEAQELIQTAAEAALSWAELGASVAMNRYNKT